MKDLDRSQVGLRLNTEASKRRLRHKNEHDGFDKKTAPKGDVKSTYFERSFEARVSKKKTSHSRSVQPVSDLVQFFFNNNHFINKKPILKGLIFSLNIAGSMMMTWGMPVIHAQDSEEESPFVTQDAPEAEEEEPPAETAPSNEESSQPTDETLDGRDDLRSPVQVEQADTPQTAQNAPNKLSVEEAASRLPWRNFGLADRVSEGLQQENKDQRLPPTQEQLESLKELEQNFKKYKRTSDSFARTVGAILRREYLRKRAGKSRWYSRQIREEEKNVDKSRDEAIEAFEKFIQEYPDDPKYTPDAMLRLGELYFDKSAIDFQEAYDAAQENPELIPPDAPEFSAIIQLYEKLIDQFPEYKRIDGVYYLLGYCLNESGQDEKALIAWLNLVCQNQFKYEPTPVIEPEVPEEKNGEHPSLTLDSVPEPIKPFEGSSDFFASCQPVVNGSRFASETWFRIGEYHFDDYGRSNALEYAIAAYKKVLEDKENRNFNLALYKVAWAYYRASNYPAAIESFSNLVKWSEAEKKRTGKQGSELRPEAIKYLGISFAYDDWNENQVPDVYEGMPNALARIQDPKLLDQDKEWTAEVYFELGNVFMEEAKYPEAIEAWQLALTRWPLHVRAPEITNLIAKAYEKDEQFDKAVEARAKLAQYGPGSEWFLKNSDSPGEQRDAVNLAENALIETALHFHQQAQEQRRQCIANQDPEQCIVAQNKYASAALAYKDYLQKYPNTPQAYELHYNLADALFWSENYADAALEYAAVRDSNLDDIYLSESARRVVESYKRIMDAQVEEGHIEIRSKAPSAEGTPPQVNPIELPQLLQRLAEERENYLARISSRADKENLRDAYSFNNTLLLYFYGYWPEAKVQFRKIFDQRCKGKLADETGRLAWLNLRTMAVVLQKDQEIEKLGKEIRQRKCTFNAELTEPSTVDCSAKENENHPQCLVLSDLNSLKYRKAINVYREAEKLEGEASWPLYEKAATMLVGAVNRNPGDPQAPIALEWAATALERTNRFESAASLYQRIVDEVGPRQAQNEKEQGDLDAILSNAYFRLAYNANRFFDFEKALENYQILATSPRFENTQDPSIVERKEDALVNSAIILERLQQYGKAVDYYREVAETTKNEEVRQRAYYQIAEMAFKRKTWSRSIRDMRQFIKLYRGNEAAGELVVQAAWRIAQAQAAVGRDNSKALYAVVKEFNGSGQPAGSIAAEYAAEAKFRLVDAGLPAYERIKIEPSKPKTLEAYVTDIAEQIENGARKAKEMADAYQVIPDFGRPRWTIASFARQGRVYEVLAKAVLNIPFLMPRDLKEQLKQLPEEDQEEVRFQVEDRIREVLDGKVRPIECFAVARYALAARAARAASYSDEYTEMAIDRLQAYGEERIAECIAEAQAQDASFQAYESGEFTRAAQGKRMQVDSSVAPPALKNKDESQAEVRQ